MRILYHDNCFDGLASAAVFARFFHEAVNPDAEIEFVGVTHKPRMGVDPAVILSGDGAENAIVDFKYSPHPNVSWWFDHHLSAFLTPEDEAHFNADTSGRKFYDPDSKSCTLFIAQVLKDRFSWERPELDGLVYWANVIDGALYPDAKTAVDLAEPALKLMQVVEMTRNPQTIQRLLRDMQHHSLAEIVEMPYIAEQLGPLLERHHRSIQVIREHGEYRNNVLYFDVAGFDIEGYNKFIPYFLHPDCRYNVSVLDTPTRSKISVGFNPWSPLIREHNIAKICERYGGGGHPVVGAISLAPEELDEARRIAREIAAELRSPGPGATSMLAPPPGFKVPET
ncbi:MAG TPA: phosphoesterase [Blastocatellia bacterium]|nr:phosphoesterase [Blastocatellia bacterium]